MGLGRRGEGATQIIYTSNIIKKGDTRYLVYRVTGYCHTINSARLCKLLKKHVNSY